MRTALSPFQFISLEGNAPSPSASNDVEKSAYPETRVDDESDSVDGFNQSVRDASYVKRSSDAKSPRQDSASHASMRSKRSPIQVEPRQGINQSWQDFQEEHFEWKHGRSPSSLGEIPEDEGKLPPRSALQAFVEWIAGFIFGGPVAPEEGMELPVFRSEEVDHFPIGEAGSGSRAEVKQPASPEGPSSFDMEKHAQPPAFKFRPEDFEVKNLDEQRLTARFNVYHEPGKSQEYLHIDGKWYATAQEKGERFVYKPDEDGVASTWPVREEDDGWHFASNDELPGRSIVAAERIPAGYRVDVPAGLQEADAQGIYRADGQEYIKIEGALYRSGQDGSGRYIYDGNPSHRIAVQGTDRGWTITPPSRGLGGAPLTPVEVIQNIFNMTEVQARDYLSQYRFDTNGPYTEDNFTHELDSTYRMPGWAERFRVRLDTPSPHPISGDASHPAPPGGMDVINPVSRQRIHIDEGGYLNSVGMIERADVPQLYRAIDSVNAGRIDPTQAGFHKSYRFNVVPKMIRGPGVITSADRHGPDLMFGLWDKWLNHYAIYRIDSMGLRCTSLQENIKSNPAIMERMFNVPRGVFSEINAVRDETLRTRLFDDITWKAYSAKEVHVENEHLDPSRIKFEEGSITFDVDLPENMQSPDSAKTWSPPTSPTRSLGETEIVVRVQPKQVKTLPRMG
jgi:hypothetical protein